jgi:SAM-dependent methyltransferase
MHTTIWKAPDQRPWCADEDSRWVVAELARHWSRHQVIALDNIRGPRCRHRVLGDAQRIPIRSESVDVAWGVQLLQYVPDKLACLADVYRVLAPDGIAVFAMTEHFDGMSAFAPPLIELARSWCPPGVITDVRERQLGARRVLTFALSKRSSTLSGVQPLAAIHHSGTTTRDTNPYIRSVYCTDATFSS